jgi:hypothetical protein
MLSATGAVEVDVADTAYVVPVSTGETGGCENVIVCGSRVSCDGLIGTPATVGHSVVVGVAVVSDDHLVATWGRRGQVATRVAAVPGYIAHGVRSDGSVGAGRVVRTEQLEGE